MKVLYVFSTPNASYILNDMILPQLERGSHPVTVAGMFFFVDNNYLLVQGNPTALRLARLVQAGRIGFVMGCDQCCHARDIADKLEPPASIGCFPSLYAKAGEAGVEQVITL
jgi:hypothetical protein